MTKNNKRGSEIKFNYEDFIIRTRKGNVKFIDWDKLKSFIRKVRQEAREEGWQAGHKQTKEDYEDKLTQERTRVLEEVEKVREELEGTEEMVSLDSILYKLDHLLQILRKKVRK